MNDEFTLQEHETARLLSWIISVSAVQRLILLYVLDAARPAGAGGVPGDPMAVYTLEQFGEIGSCDALTASKALTGLKARGLVTINDTPRILGKAGGMFISVSLPGLIAEHQRAAGGAA